MEALFLMRCFSRFPSNCEEGCTLVLLPFDLLLALGCEERGPTLAIWHICTNASLADGVRVCVFVWLGFVFLSKDGPDEEEGREKLNSEKKKAAFAVGAQDGESADAGSISGTAAKLPGCQRAKSSSPISPPRFASLPPNHRTLLPSPRPPALPRPRSILGGGGGHRLAPHSLTAARSINPLGLPTDRRGIPLPPEKALFWAGGGRAVCVPPAPGKGRGGGRQRRRPGGGGGGRARRGRRQAGRAAQKGLLQPCPPLPAGLGSAPHRISFPWPGGGAGPLRGGGGGGGRRLGRGGAAAAGSGLASPRPAPSHAGGRRAGRGRAAASPRRGPGGHRRCAGRG